MDGTRRDNVFVERLWRSLQYEEVYLHAYETVCDAPGRDGTARYQTFYNQLRPHRVLDGRMLVACIMITACTVHCCIVIGD